MPCEEYRALVEKRGEERLPDEQERLLADHLPDCESCRKAVALQRLDDTALHNALLGLPTGRAAEAAGARRLTRMVVVPTVMLALVLFGLWALYRSFDRAAENRRELRMAAAALDRTVMPRSLRRNLPVVLADFADQIGAPVELAPAERAGDPAEAIEVTFVLERSIRLRSALWLLAHFHRASFLVGEDRVPFPQGMDDSRNVLPASHELERRLRDERVTLSYSGDRLVGALQYIDDVKGLNLLVAPTADAKVAAATARLEVRDARIGEVLDGLLSGTGLGWTVRHECVVIDEP